MPEADKQKDDWVLRIVYDGTGGAGKTTNVAMLSQRFGRDFSSPESPGQRTLYFDWMQYEAGSYDGKAIRCEVISVPGQNEYLRRRKVLLSTADAVVYVVDASNTELDVVARNLVRLRDCSASGIRPGIVVQLNKSDLSPKKISQADLETLCGRLQMDIFCIHATACEGLGVQETFVMAVRAALQRFARLKSAEDRTTPTNPDQLLAWIKACEQSDTGPSTMSVPEMSCGGNAAVSGSFVASDVKSLSQAKSGAPYKIEESSTEKTLSNKTEEPHHCAPDNRVESQDSDQYSGTVPRPSELPHCPPKVIPARDTPTSPFVFPPAELMTWPPKLGREILLEIGNPTVEMKSMAPDTWTGDAQGQWRLYSGAHSHFVDQESGRRALLRWSRAVEPGTTKRLFSQPRFWLLAPAHPPNPEIETAWRIWQVYRQHACLKQQLDHVAKHYKPEDIARTVIEAAAQLFEIHSYRKSNRTIPAPTIHNVGSHDKGPQVVDIMPRPWKRVSRLQQNDDLEILRRSSLLRWRNFMWPRESSFTECILAVGPEFSESWHRRAIESLLTYESQRDANQAELSPPPASSALPFEFNALDSIPLARDAKPQF